MAEIIIVDSESEDEMEIEPIMIVDSDSEGEVEFEPINIFDHVEDDGYMSDDSAIYVSSSIRPTVNTNTVCVINVGYKQHILRNNEEYKLWVCPGCVDNITLQGLENWISVMVHTTRPKYDILITELLYCHACGVSLGQIYHSEVCPHCKPETYNVYAVLQ